MARSHLENDAPADERRPKKRWSAVRGYAANITRYQLKLKGAPKTEPIEPENLGINLFFDLSRCLPSVYYAEDATTWTRAQLDQNAFREGVGIAQAEADRVKARVDATAEAQQPATRRRTR